VALKALRPHRTGAQRSAEWIKNEAEAVAKLNQPPCAWPRLAREGRGKEATEAYERAVAAGPDHPLLLEARALRARLPR
jgi:hypothetical protein